MKVDFTKFPLFTGIDRQDMVIADIRKDIADGIYRNVPGLPAHVLAEKIYRNELVELADDEIHILDLYTSASVGQLADSWQDYKKTIWKLVNKNIMEKMELSEALKANASVLEELIGVATSEKDGLMPSIQRMTTSYQKTSRSIVKLPNLKIIQQEYQCLFQYLRTMKIHLRLLFY